MRVKFLLCIAWMLFAALPIFAQDRADEATNFRSPIGTIYDVRFTLSLHGQKSLRFVANPNNRGTFRLRGRTSWDPPNITTPAVWDRITLTLMTFSGEVQFPIGNCCRETGTLIFKGEVDSNGIIVGKTIFVTNTPDTGSPTGFVIRTGEFTATPLPIVSKD